MLLAGREVSCSAEVFGGSLVGYEDWGLSKAKVTSSRVALVASESPLAAVVDGSPTPHLRLPVALAKTAQRKTGAASLVYFPYKLGSLASLTNARLRATFAGITPTLVELFPIAFLFPVPALTD